MHKSLIYKGLLVKETNSNHPCLVLDRCGDRCSLVDIITENTLTDIPCDNIVSYSSKSDFNNINKYIQHKCCRENPTETHIYDSGDHIWFTSDTHFNHDNIIRFCNRPFANVQEMNEKLIENWNSCVEKDDIVYHLGDFAWGGSQSWCDILNRLNGHIHLILGNHDIKNIKSTSKMLFESVSYQKQIQIGEQHIYLNHFPFLAYGGSYRGVWQLFGHVHTSNHGENNGKDHNRMGILFDTQYDVGVDNNDYKPISFKEIQMKC